MKKFIDNNDMNNSFIELEKLTKQQLLSIQGGSLGGSDGMNAYISLPPIDLDPIHG